MDFGQHYRTIARPFEPTFTRANLDSVIEKISRHEPQPSRSPLEEPAPPVIRTRLELMAGDTNGAREPRFEREAARGPRAWLTRLCVSSPTCTDAERLL
jgi:hypothetical protein